MNTDDGNTRNPPSRKAVEKSMLDHAVANAEEIASLRAQLAAVEKERDETKKLYDDAESRMQDCSRSIQAALGRALKFEKERDEKAESNIELLLAKQRAEKERDEATGALAAAMEALAEVVLCTVGIFKSEKAQRALSSPAVDLAARHDTEVERRALEEVWPVIEEAIDWMGHNPPTTGYGTLDHGQDKDRADIVRRLRAFEPGATPTPEKP